MSGTSLITLRLPKLLVERADALLDELTDVDEAVLIGRASRSIVLRLAVLRGLVLLEAQVAGGGTRRDVATHKQVVAGSKQAAASRDKKRTTSRPRA
jgi:hypothetical protein